MTHLKPKTILTHDGKGKYPEGAVVPPIFQNSLFTYDTWEEIDQAFEARTSSYIYSRGNNPSVEIVEEKLALLARGERAKLFPSGMAAISASILSATRKGSHIIAVKNIYGPANNLIQSYLAPKFDMTVSFVEGSNISDFEDVVQENTDVIYLESPSSVVFSLQDIAAVAQLARSRGITTIIDNTWATPIFQKPLTLGIDLEVHSCSKYLGGHSDIVAGVVIGSSERLENIFTKEFELLGAKAAPFEAWLLLRSLRTLDLRLRQHQESAGIIATMLEDHDKVDRVHYPGLPTFPQKELGEKQMSGYTGLMSFKLKSQDLSKIKRFFNSLEVFQIGVSWGGHESLIYAPAISYLKELSTDRFEALGISLGDMRISVGLEDTQDLVADLRNALELL